MRILKKVIIVAALLVISPAICAYADWALDDVSKAINNGLSYDELKALENKYQRRVMGGIGYVFMVRKATTINGYEVHLLNEYDESKLESKSQGDVCVVIPDGSPFSTTAEKLEIGQKVSFSGKMDHIFGKTIYIQGTAKITLK